MYGLQRHYPWNVGEDDPNDLAAAKAQLAALAKRPQINPNAAAMIAAQGLAPFAQHAMAAPNPNAFFGGGAAQAAQVVPVHVAHQCGAPHLAGAPWELLAQFLQSAAFNVALPQRGRFNPDGFYGNVPTKGATEDLPLTSASAIAAGATANMTQTVQKPFQGDKIMLFGDVGSFVITSITAAGQTVTASAGDLPASVYQYVDSWPNIGLPPLTAGASIVLAVRNVSAVAANMSGSIRGKTGEG